MENSFYSSFIARITVHIKHRNSADLCNQLARIVDSTAKTIYNKLNGRSRFSVEEMMTICSHYGISIDQFIYENNPKQRLYSFKARGLHYIPRDLTEYVDNLILHFRPLVESREVVRSTYLSRELPIFHYFLFPQLLYMKLYMWNSLNWNIHQVKTYQPNLWLDQKEVQDKIEYFVGMFSSLEEEEIWSNSLIDTTISQIEKLIKLSVIVDPYVKQKLKQELIGLVDYLDHVLSISKKIDSKGLAKADLHVFINHYTMTSDMINIQMGEKSLNYIMVDTPNFLESQDPEFCSAMQQYTDNVKLHSIRISKSNKFEKDLLIQILRSKIEQISAF